MSFLFYPIKNASFRIISASETRFIAVDPLKRLLRSSSSTVRFLAKHNYLDWNRRTSTSTTITTKNTAAAMAVKAVPDEEGIARRFWIKFRDESVFAMYSPFVVCLASGKLELETFRHYIAQDVHFLRAFVQAYELAEDCADDDDDKSAISELRKHVMEELKMHKSFVQEWGFDPANEISATLATLKYTDFLLATASGKVEGGKGHGKIATPFEKTKVAAYTLSAMTPCMRLYAFLGKELRALLDPEEGSHLYKKWIDNYASESFETSAQQTEELLDKLSVSLTGEELEVMEKLYHQAMKLEIEFFTAQPIVQRTIVPFTRMLDPAEYHLVLFSDFDLTCTIVDSSAILAEIAILTVPKADQSGMENPLPRMSSADLRNTWGVLSGQYTEEYEQCIESAMPPEKVQDFNYEELSKALETLSDFEKRANARVIESGVLKGLNLEDIKKAGERLILQDGCTGFFQTIVQNEELKADIHILSYCWCDDLIRSAFSSEVIWCSDPPIMHDNLPPKNIKLSTWKGLLIFGF
ncbi:bifunctional TH2 protein, mitochondrial-like isoform X2 [Telopea speciosissima]|uniref:bifunctional TH2 protein, mitochondrial-like isoform X2 n=1 Tax=Telopea speciosissima TaxID=54955 RepID=UPI001CC3FB28|nr:bifunctional TH2 protein, mitochondrial-like isoform X2 [Telopea speciosissima]